MNGAYGELILDAADVCRNCLRRVRVERIDPVRGGLGGELDSHYERHRRRTNIGYGPARAASDVKGVFCDCGVEGSHERVWTDEDVERARFRELARNAVESLEEKGVTLRRKTAYAYALQARADGGGVDEAIASGVSAGIAAAAGGDASETRPRADEPPTYG